jgi:hypothetical protein
MNDLFDALYKAVHDYVHIDTLTPRQQQRIRGIYEQYHYSYDVVEELVRLDDTEDSKPAKKKKATKKTKDEDSNESNEIS